MTPNYSWKQLTYQYIVYVNKQGRIEGSVRGGYHSFSAIVHELSETSIVFKTLGEYITEEYAKVAVEREVAMRVGQNSLRENVNSSSEDATGCIGLLKELLDTPNEG